MSSDLATALWSARTEGGVIAVDAGQRPADYADAYAIQGEVAALFESEVVGWKLGATNDKALQLMGFDRPFVGPLLSVNFHDMNDVLVVYPEHGPSLETEFLVTLGSDLPPRTAPYTDDEVMAAVDDVRPAFEVVGCRVDDGFTAAGLLLIADSAANVAVIPGQPSANWRDADLSKHPLKVEVNGVEAASGSSNLLMWGNPFGAVSYLASHPQAAERGLRRGDCIMTGTCGGLLALNPGDRAAADFGVLGNLRLEVA
ncbi:MAG: fumarylacetoacetate (FAA) hydrolase [Gammaproteobacteria bacterium]|nr:MAG: fumarylacetoacetate (FAA) hydrolase [Gammaproteobacteria bacterium]